MIQNFLYLINFTKFGFIKNIPKSEYYPQETINLSDKYFVVTGANSGLGFETTKTLLSMDANVIVICRNKKKMQEAKKQLPKTGQIFEIYYDLSELANTSHIISEISKFTSTINGYVHNAGALLNEKKETSLGHEMIHSLMSLSTFKITKALIESEINVEKFIWVSSGGMYGASLNLDDPNFNKRKYNGVQCYAENKRIQVDIANLFAKKYPNTQFFSMHPGWVDTPGVQNSLPIFRAITQFVLRNYYQGIDTIIYLLHEDNIHANGEFWFDREIAPQELFKKGKRTSEEEKNKLWSYLQQF